MAIRTFLYTTVKDFVLRNPFTLIFSKNASFPICVILSATFRKRLPLIFHITIYRGHWLI